MVVVISDLHLCDETVGKHNVNPEEVQMVFKDLAASPFEPEEIVLVLLGDIFDINRSTLWMEVPEA
jgi:UDP-2,3-diacylglucosamine pyrophosphatase LpxH